MYICIWIDSCLGRYDGQVYEALMERARLNPTNQHKVKKREIWNIETKSVFFLLGPSYLVVNKTRNIIETLDLRESLFINRIIFPRFFYDCDVGTLSWCSCYSEEKNNNKDSRSIKMVASMCSHFVEIIFLCFDQ